MERWYFPFIIVLVISFLFLSNGKVTLNEKKKIAWRAKLKRDALKKLGRYEVEKDKDVIIYWVGSYLAAHKYYGVDPRKIEKKSTFYRHFAIPVLSKLHPTAQKACEQGPVFCIKEVYLIAAQSATMFGLYHTKIHVFQELHYPFESLDEMFQYRMTASYFLCWFTMRQDEVLSRLYPHCFNYFNGHLIHEGIGKPINDFRDHMNKRFNCALLWFCPDRCYGRTNKGNLYRFNKDIGNPCYDFPNKECSFSQKNNNNFHDLIRNKFNYTCECRTELIGYAWDQRYSVCSDFDECRAQTVSCPGKKDCVNTDGGYTCKCKPGMIETSRDECKCRTNMLINVEGECSCPAHYRMTSHGSCQPLPYSTRTMAGATPPIGIEDTNQGVDDVFGGINTFDINDAFSFSRTTPTHEGFSMACIFIIILHVLCRWFNIKEIMWYNSIY